ncbi:MAG: hypothetical protein HUU50_22545 [Candidatus Brocadiae bacterium]|nr:hypothetical protein [Candidatus Brocadiia bacterium]
MTPARAYRIADLLTGMNVLLGICIIALSIKLAMVWAIPKAEEKEQALPPRREIKKEVKKDLSSMEICWKAPILEPEPVPKKEEQKIKPKPAKTKAFQTTFAWCSVFVHPDPPKSVAILSDTKNGKQTLCKIGDILEKKFQVLEITYDWVKIGWEEHYALIARPETIMIIKNTEKQEK